MKTYHVVTIRFAVQAKSEKKLSRLIDEIASLVAPGRVPLEDGSLFSATYTKEEQ